MKLEAAVSSIALLALAAAGCERSAPSSSAPGAPPVATQAAPAAPAAAAAGAAAGKVAARYGEETLTAEELVVELQRLPDRSRRTMTADARAKFVENYVLNELLFAEGEREGVTADPEIQRQVEDLRKRLVVQKVVRKLQDLPAITDEQVKAYYDANPEKFSTATIKARHILVKDEAKAKELQAQVKADPTKFADVAKESSTDTASARKGGDLGFFGRGRMVPEFEAVAFSMKPGEVSEVVKTPYGYHVIQVEEVREGTQKQFDMVKEQIRATLRSQELQARTKAFYDDLKKRASFTVDTVVIEEVAVEVAKSAPSEPAGAEGLPLGHPPVGGAAGGSVHGGAVHGGAHEGHRH